MAVPGKLRVNTCLRGPTNIILGRSTKKKRPSLGWGHFEYKYSLDTIVQITSVSTRDTLSKYHILPNFNFNLCFCLVSATSPVSSFLRPIIEFSSRGLPTIFNSIFWPIAIFLSPGVPCKAQLSPAPIGRSCPGRIVAPARSQPSNTRPLQSTNAHRGQELPNLRARIAQSEGKMLAWQKRKLHN